MAHQRSTRTDNPIRALQAFGQSVWLDYLRRSLFTSGEFRRLIAEDGLRGVTANPSIFEKAIVGSTDYLSDSSSAVLFERGRRALRVHLGADVARGLTNLHAALTHALSLGRH